MKGWVRRTQISFTLWIRKRPPPGAIARGAFFAAVTSYTLFTDVISGGLINTSHVLALAALVAAIASGHMAWPQLRLGAVMPALLLGVLFLGATASLSFVRRAECRGVR